MLLPMPLLRLKTIGLTRQDTWVFIKCYIFITYQCKNIAFKYALMGRTSHTHYRRHKVLLLLQMPQCCMKNLKTAAPFLATAVTDLQPRYTKRNAAIKYIYQ
jgi:hypothetical protein